MAGTDTRPDLPVDTQVWGSKVVTPDYTLPLCQRTLDALSVTWLTDSDCHTGGVVIPDKRVLDPHRLIQEK